MNTVLQNPGSKMLRSVPFAPCPGEAGIATYTLSRGRVLEVAFAVENGRDVVARYERPATVGDAPEAVTALRQAVCYAL